jgi:hypothetical protein
MFVNVPRKQMLPIIAVLLLSLLSKGVIAETTGKLTGDFRVVGGTDANELPTLAFTKGTKLCAATLIHTE